MPSGAVSNAAQKCFELQKSVRAFETINVQLVLGRKWRRDSLRLIALALLLLTTFEGIRVYTFWREVTASRAVLLSLADRALLGDPGADGFGLEERRPDLMTTRSRLDNAARFTRDDPLFKLAGQLPILEGQVSGTRGLVSSALISTNIAIELSAIISDLDAHQGTGGRSSVEAGVAYIDEQRPAMGRVKTDLQQLQRQNQEIPSNLAGPLAGAHQKLDAAMTKLTAAVEGYDDAAEFLPLILGLNGPRSYLVLPQNSAELFPSGGLVSSYGIMTVDRGRLSDMKFEYFGTLFDRWQKASGEYIEPPTPLKNYLKHNYSWALGEAGWYPDFTTTASLATSFVEKGVPFDAAGTISIDLAFTRELLRQVGPVEVPEYGVTVTAANFEETALELTRDETYRPGEPQKAFLSYLSRAMLAKVFSISRSQWLDMLAFLGRMGRERHLQLYFKDPALERLAEKYSFSGQLAQSDGDFLLVADTSVNSTKLNLILQPEIQVALSFPGDGKVHSSVTYALTNPLPVWAQGRDPRLVSTLMLQGVYGSYTRLYAGAGAKLVDVLVDRQSAGPEEVSLDAGRVVFGRFFPVLPGKTASVTFAYVTDAGIEQNGQDFSYQLKVQKEAGTEAIPLEFSVRLPSSATNLSISVDGEKIGGNVVKTNLRTDRDIEVEYRDPIQYAKD